MRDVCMTSAISMHRIQIQLEFLLLLKIIISFNIERYYFLNLEKDGNT